MLASTVSWSAAWLAWLFVMGLIAFPLAYRLMPTLASRGIALSPVLGLLLVSYLSWLLASLHLLAFGRASLLIAAAVVAAITAVVEVRARGAAVRWLRGHFGVALAYGLALLAVFAVFCWLRGYYPDVRSTEKPMEISFLTSTMRAHWMPPNDAWLSGYTINYYYFGYVEAGALGLLGGLRPEVTFNLMSVTIPALTFVGASGIAYDLIVRWRAERSLRTTGLGAVGASLTGGALVALAGNAYGFARLLSSPGAVLGWGTTFWTGIGWNSSRVVHDRIVPGQLSEMITEFPMFSFILGDIHPHVLALPIVLLSLGVALGFWLKPSGDGAAMIGRYLLAALILGALYPTNAWDLPTFALPVLAAVALRRWRGRWHALRHAGGILIAAIVLYLPYYLHFQSIVGNHEGGEPAAVHDLANLPVLGRIIRTFGVVVWPHTDLRQFLAVFAVPLAAAGTLVLRGNIARPAPLTESQRRIFLGAAVSVGLIALLTRTAMLLPTGVIIIGGAMAFVRPTARRPADPSPWAGAGAPWAAWAGWTPMDRTVTAVAIYGALLPVITEFFFLRDAFDNRMNTMFKVDYQAWILLMLAGAYGIVTLAKQAASRPEGTRRQQAVGGEQNTQHSALMPPMLPRGRPHPQHSALLRIGLVVFILFAATYPVVVPFQRTGHFGATAIDFGGPGLGWQGMDGFGYLRTSNPDEYGAAMWLRANAQDGDRLIEALGNSYGDANGWFESRFSAATGTPAVLGWYFHEYQWHAGSQVIVDHELPQRAKDIGTVYNTTNGAEAKQILAQYGINWVIVGANEQDGEGRCGLNAGCPPYAAAGLAKFNDMLDLAYRQGRVSIYHVP